MSPTELEPPAEDALAADEPIAGPDADAPRRDEEPAGPAGTMSPAEAMSRLARGEMLRGVRVDRLVFNGEIAHPVRMRDVRLVQPVFERATFAEEVVFQYCTIDRPRFNKRNVFAKGLDLNGSTLVNAALRGLDVSGVFQAANLKARGKLVVANSTFRGRVRFWEARFEGWVELKQCKFDGEADLRSMHAEEGFALNDCKFAGDFLFRGSTVCKKFDAGKSRFDALVDLSKAKLHDFAYLEAIQSGPAQRFAFHNAVAERLLVRPEQVAGRLGSEEAGDHGRASEEYGLLKRVFEGLHRYDAEDWAFYRFKVNQRRRLPRSWRRPWSKMSQLFDWLLLDMGCGYGTHPLRAVRASLLIMLAFGLIYMAGAGTLPVERWPFPGRGDAAYWPNRVMVGLLTSVSVFTSGFGGIRDAAEGWMNIPLICESLLGTLLWGLFIVAFSRKVIR